MAIHIALLLTLLETLAMSAVLLAWAKEVRGARLLVVFLLGVATWIVGNELPSWVGIGAAPLAMALLSSVPLTSAAFLHFCATFCEVPLGKRWIWGAYGLAASAMTLSLVRSPGEFRHYPPFEGVEWVVVPNAVGWTTGLVWAFLAAAGMLVLMSGLWRAASPQRRRQIAAVAVSCGWGLLAMSGYTFAALDIPLYPWQVLAAPAYPVILVYGILRYRVFVANVWARRALASAILILLGVMVVPLTVLLPFESKWVNAVAVAATCLALSGPVWRVASRLVYPGGTPSADDLRHWRAKLSRAPSLSALADTAAELVSQRMRLAVGVRVGSHVEDAPAGASAHVLAGPHPTLVCLKAANAEPGVSGEWQTTLIGFDEAPPGQRHLAELFGAMLADAAAQVEVAVAAEQRERERQLQARLAELGSLAATVAHDLRNPLNIIAMAVALAPDDTRHEVNEQITRISRLAEDLLDYAKPWQIQPIETDIAQRVQGLVRRMPEVEIGPGLAVPMTATLDPVRFDQAVCNLLSNARAAAGTRRVQLDAERACHTVRLHVCDDGPGISPDLRDKLFQPFASRSPGGTGLGLAIVARIMAAHGGSAELTERAPWRTCFTLTFPQQEASLS
ncbi:ATP-binding protein [Caldimonas brevitalea]|nr:ATP-binding protein [Caldimonas brevitalea]